MSKDALTGIWGEDKKYRIQLEKYYKTQFHKDWKIMHVSQHILLSSSNVISD